MDMPQSIPIRNKIIGLLVKRTRIKAKKSQRECAEFLGISPSRYGRFERGRLGMSLPQLEALAYLLDVPAASLWDERHEPAEVAPSEELPMARLMGLRRRMLAVRFRQCRLAAGMTQKDMAQVLNCSSGMVSLYERGLRDISLAELELAAERCGYSLADLIDEHTIPLSQAEQDRQALALLDELSPEMREFVLKPTNALYVRIAMALSNIKVDSLRQIAETLLEITY
jgi:transcriptional regulator with XRE-family HTH domain